MNTIKPDLARLADPFPFEDVEWKPGAVTRDKSKGLAMAYISSRAVQDRLDEVCGPDGWRNEFTQAPEGGVLCGISIRITREDGDGNVHTEWITKWDGAENTEVEAIKGGLSNAMKRAAVQWGIGRYLYKLPQQWVRLDERGRFAETPRIARAFLPEGSGAPGERGRPEPARPEPARPAQRPEPRPAPAPAAPPVPRAGERRVIRPAAEGNGHPRPTR
ncbi:MAG TPA: Rad52/Rad22 family DNA repair protein [Rubricoccaceae bacterium]|nr:Rad52/Rad22 family DNA repair protein [Rubricoccaceae bacterium]